MKELFTIKKTFSIRAIIKQSWEVFEREWKVLAGAAFAYLIISMLTGGDEKNMSTAQEVIGLLINLLVAYLYIGALRITLRMIRGEAYTWAHLKTSGKQLLTIIGAAILYALFPIVLVGAAFLIGGVGMFAAAFTLGVAGGVGFIIGMCLFIVVILLYSLRFGMWIYFVMDRNYKPVAALKASWKATRGSTLRLFGFVVITCFAFVIGMIPFGLGLLIVLPVYLLAQAAIYERLAKHMLGESSEFPVEQPAELPASKPIETDINIKPEHHDAPEVSEAKEEPEKSE